MQLHEFAAAFAAVLVVTAGAAVAAPGNANSTRADGHAEASTSASANAGTPTETAEKSDGNETATETTGESDATDAESGERSVVSVSVSAEGSGSGANVNASADAAGEGSQPADASDNAPSHVEHIHVLIREHVAGTLSGSLGDAIAGVLGGGQAEEADENTMQSDGDETRRGEQVGDEKGPRTDIPDSVPSHVERIHVLIRERVSGVLAGNGSQTQARGSANVSADATTARS